MTKFQLIATAAFGLEAVVAQELKELGYADQMVENGRVTFAGTAEAICRTNLWLRSADRVLVKVGEFPAVTFTELFEQTKALPWEEWLPRDAEFPVVGKSVKAKLFSVSDCQAIVKKAIVERLKQTYRQSWFEETGAKYKVEVALLKDRATLTIDTSGAGLHKRGYRELTGPAPLRETLAAALLRLSKWPAERVLADPFCGSGTIPIEGALLALKIAPGLKRSFSAEKWPNIPSRLWQLARTEAEDIRSKGGRPVRILGTDHDEKALSLARHHARKAGLENQLHFQRLAVSDFRSRFDYGCVICNPPYGQRLGEVQEAEKIYRQLGELALRLPTWSFFVISPHKGFEKLFGRRAQKKRKLYNGRIECHYYQYPGPLPAGAAD